MRVVKIESLAGRKDTNEARFAAALARIDDGTFGLCVECGRPIERKKLDAEPFTERCASCRSRRMRGGALDA